MKKISLLVATMFLAFNTSAYALFGAGDIVFDPTAVGQFITSHKTQLLQFAKDAKTAFNTAMQVKKALGSDQLFQNLANVALNTTTEQAALWAKVGFNGGPAVVENINEFKKNIDLGVVDTVIKQVTGSNSSNLFGNSVASALAVKTRSSQNTIAQQIAPTLGSAIQSDVCTDAKLTLLANERQNQLIASGDYSKNIESIKSQLRTKLCTGGVASKTQQSELNNCFATDFNCGGWKAWLDLTSNPNNTLTGQLIAANTLTTQAQATAQENKKATMDGNTLSKTQCLDAPSSVLDPYLVGINTPNKPPCKNEVVVTPASLVKDIINKTTSAGLDRVVASQGLNGFQSNFGNLLNTTMSNDGYLSKSSNSSLTGDALANIPIGTNTVNDSNAGINDALIVFNDGFKTDIINLNSLKSTINEYLSYISASRNELAQITSCVTNGKASVVASVQTLLENSRFHHILTPEDLIIIDDKLEKVPEIISFKSFVFTTNNNLTSKEGNLNTYLGKISDLTTNASSAQEKINNVATSSPLEIQKIYQDYTDKNILENNNDYTSGVLEGNLQSEYLQEKDNIGNIRYDPKDPIAVQLDACTNFIKITPSTGVPINPALKPELFIP